MAKTRKKMAVRKQLEAQQKGLRKRWMIFATTLVAIISVSSLAFWVAVQPEQEVVEKPQQLMPIRLVEILGDLERVTQSEIKSVLKQQSADQQADEQGVNFLTTDIKQLENSLEQLPWVYRAQLRRVWPDKLLIDIQEQQAIAQWNKTQLVNQYGETFEPEVMPNLEVPVLSGPEDTLADMLQTFQNLQRMFESEDLQMHALYLNSRKSWQITLANGIELQVGRKDLEGRVQRFIALYPLLQSESQPIESVDLRYDTGLAVLRFESPQRQASL